MVSLKIQNLKKSYGAAEVIKSVSFDVAQGEFVVFVGPSGCGKSTLLRMIAGLEEISGGDLLIDGQRVNDVAPDRRGLAMVFQSYALYPHMTVAENMGFALRLAGVPKEERRKKVEDAARILQLETLLDRKPANLSGGQRQRVAIGRAIVRHPKIFLFDEPLSNLDAALRGQTRMELVALHRQLKGTMIYVTHDQVEAMTMADRIVVLRAGVVEQIGRPLELYNEPANTFVAGFIGSPKMNLLNATVRSSDGERIELTLDGGQSIRVGGFANVQADARVTLGLRPDMLKPADDGPIFGTIVLSEQLGKETLIHVDLGTGEPLTVSYEGQHAMVIGARISLTPDLDRLHLFNESGTRVDRVRSTIMA
ncbi:sn-glycerol-3-phosphate ABC transporter ATP-binding protein UgpC [Rhizobium sp. NLR17b]|uniref:ABC transporter ATP-binding protein n=1 Tax=Rhizobium sp. NLR17b TaxID=2731114 RepID=UPI001C83AF5A|nr:sn-glycerol-3-phosphate ABC transporter ATP-binding protein UgpC [Rhizobium sp. NLR17b]MBX5272678.1 sn-glycerol-3-phosphate ABC transporter ATP-binding protein UgpC [Rhizobium sp. NLR17b]